MSSTSRSSGPVPPHSTRHRDPVILDLLVPAGTPALRAVPAVDIKPSCMNCSSISAAADSSSTMPYTCPSASRVTRTICANEGNATCQCGRCRDLPPQGIVDLLEPMVRVRMYHVAFLSGQSVDSLSGQHRLGPGPIVETEIVLCHNRIVLHRGPDSASAPTSRGCLVSSG